MYKWLVCLLLVSCSGSPDVTELEGKWEITEMYSSGIKNSSKGWINFQDDGTYSAVIGDSVNAMEGNWKLFDEDVIHLWQREIRDLNGNRFAEPYNSSWTYFHAGDYLVLEGLPEYNVQHLKLIMHKTE